MSLSGHQSARMKSDSWLTPPEWIKWLGPFDLDPCCPPKMPWPTAKRMLTKRDNGLKAKWRGFVWLNPPFGQQVGVWLARLREHGHGIALVAARTETQWFYENIWDWATAVCFVRGRPHFHYTNGQRADFNSGAPIALAAYGETAYARLRSSGLGQIVQLRPLSAAPAQKGEG